jgi:glyoxylase-like metal-dependent hydrolase (beta-lactamase superfamily II)
VLLIDTPQQPIDALRWRERITEQHGRILHLVNTEPHPDHIRGNAYFPGVEVIGHELMPARYQASVVYSRIRDRVAAA